MQNGHRRLKHPCPPSQAPPTTHQLLIAAAHDADVLRDGLVGHQLLLHAADEDADGAGAHKLGRDLLHLPGPCGTARGGACV